MTQLPKRNPVVLAKELATLDVVSGGRLLFGLGAGYLEPEFRALGAPFEQRGAVTNEAIEAIKALWMMEKPTYQGWFFSFGGIDAQPRPIQNPIRRYMWEKRAVMARGEVRRWLVRNSLIRCRLNELRRRV